MEQGRAQVTEDLDLERGFPYSSTRGSPDETMGRGEMAALRDSAKTSFQGKGDRISDPLVVTC